MPLLIFMNECGGGRRRTGKWSLIGRNVKCLQWGNKFVFFLVFLLNVHKWCWSKHILGARLEIPMLCKQDAGRHREGIRAQEFMASL